MSQFRFTLIDYTVNPAGDSTVIDEPVGWDGLVLKLKRHPEWHGFFDYFDNAISTFQFDGVGFVLHQAAYELLGIEAQVDLLIEFACAETDTFEELYTGRFDFNTYTENCGDRCYIEINVETTSCLVQFKNRYDQKVDIESLRTFDLPKGDADDLVAYTGIGTVMELLENKIQLTSLWETVDPTTDTYLTVMAENLFNQYIYSPSMRNIVQDIITTIGGVFTHDEPPFNNPLNGPTDPFEWVGIDEDQPTIYSNFQVDIRLSGTFTDEFDSGEAGDEYSNNLEVQMVLWRGETWATATAVTTANVGIMPYGGGGGSSGADFASAFLGVISTNLGILAHGQKLFITFNFQQVQSIAPAGHAFQRRLTFNMDDTSYVRFVSDAFSEPTDSKVCLINETASRVTEIITGDCLRVYSDYYGREDAEPYVSAADGCGSLRVLSNGLWIRQAVQTDETEPKYMLSMQEVFEGLNAIDCIGMGVEDDPNRAGFEMLRIEKFQYFYDTAVLLTFNGVTSTKKQVDPSQIFSTYKGGYQRFETETHGGLNDIHTHRNFRTTLSVIKNALTQVCSFIASGHSIEVTRWQIGASSQDWRYDGDTFIICVKRDAGEPSGYIVQRGEDMPTADNLPNWETAYNVLISPQRNARRWMPIIVQCFVDYTSATVKFMDGDGNLIASTFIPATDVDCITQDDAVVWVNMPENSDISLSPTADFPFDPDNVEEFYPIKKAELVTFEYPLSFEQWKTIKANPRGLIEYECGGVLNAGWIEEINYNIVDGLAEFVLIPKQVAVLVRILISNAESECNEDSELIFTIDGTYVMADFYIAGTVAFTLQYWDGGAWVDVGDMTADGAGNYGDTFTLDSSLWGLAVDFRVIEIDGDIVSSSTEVTLADCSPSCDEDAQAFLDAAGIIDETISAAVCQLVSDLKDASLWDKMLAIYPMVGGTATTHKFNLKNPADTNAAFRLTFAGGWTHSATGAKPNGTTGYADTHFIPNSNFSLNSAAIGTYLRTNSSSGTDIGALSSAGAQRAELWSKYIDGNFYTSLNNGTYESVAVANSAAFFVTSRTASNVLKSYRNTTIIKNVATASTAMATVSVYLASVNGGLFFSDKEQAFTFFADGLSDTEESNLYNIVQAFQTSLSRNV